MPSVQIKNVPPEAHAVLVRRAKAAGQSLQEYLLATIVRDTARPTAAEVFDRIDRGEDGRSGGRLAMADAVEALHAARADR